MVHGQISLLVHHNLVASMVIVGLKPSNVGVESDDPNTTPRGHTGQPADYLFLVPELGDSHPAQD